MFGVFFKVDDKCCLKFGTESVKGGSFAFVGGQVDLILNDDSFFSWRLAI